MPQVCCILCCCFSADRIDNSRVKSLEFEAKTSFSLHGFAGYFETVLYKDVTLSKFTSRNSPNVLRLAFIHSSPRPFNSVNPNAIGSEKFYPAMFKRKRRPSLAPSNFIL